jgi:predicted anti-sigma-YlaC factor YlaD
MTCRDACSYLPEHLAGDMPADMVDEFDAHHAECANCRAFLDQYRQAIQLGREALQNGLATDVPEDLVRAIMALAPPVSS